MGVLQISELNNGWGICGFASSLGALYENGYFRKTIDRAVSQQHLNTRLLAEIKTYLVILQSKNKIALLSEIENFTRTFGGVYAGFTINKYIAKINTIATKQPNLRDPGFSIAMPPNAVIDYLQRICEMTGARLKPCRNSASNNVILGVGDRNKSGGKWKGLGHWIYKKNNSEIYNWGKKETLAELFAHNANWQILYEISNLNN